MDNFQNPTHPVQSIISGPSECSKNSLVTNLILYINIEFKKVYIDAPCLR